VSKEDIASDVRTANVIFSLRCKDVAISNLWPLRIDLFVCPAEFVIETRSSLRSRMTTTTTMMMMKLPI